MADDYTPLHGWLLPKDREQLLELFLRERLLEIDAAAGVDLAAPVPLSAAAALTSSAFGKLHVCTGTAADYTITLPAPTLADVGKLITFQMDDALTKVVTLDAGATRSINGQQTRVMWAGEVAILRCVGTSGPSWAKLGGTFRPMSALMYLNANQSIANASGPVKVTLNSAGTNVGGMVDTTNNRFNIKRAGTYELNGQVWFNSVAVPTGLLDFYKNGAQLDETYGFSPSASNNLVIKGATVETLAAGDQLDLRVYQNSGGAQNLIGHPTNRYTKMSLVEQVGW
jgi:hypothetical protein